MSILFLKNNCFIEIRRKVFLSLSYENFYSLKKEACLEQTSLSINSFQHVFRKSFVGVNILDILVEDFYQSQYDHILNIST